MTSSSNEQEHWAVAKYFALMVVSQTLRPYSFPFSSKLLLVCGH